VFFAHSTVTYTWEKAGLVPAWLARSWPWWALKVFITKQGLDFLATAFLWLTWTECNAAWASVYYLPLLFMVGILTIGNVFPVKVDKQQGQRAEGGSGSGSSKAAAAAAAAAAASGEPVVSDHFHLGEGVKAALVPSRPGSRSDLVNGSKQE
jgi:hypothetical protein